MGMEISSNNTAASKTVKNDASTYNKAATTSSSIFSNQPTTATKATTTNDAEYYNTLRENINGRYGRDFCRNVNKNIDKIKNNPKVQKALEKYKGTPLYDDIMSAFKGDEQAILRVLSNKNIQKDVDELMKDKDIQDCIIDIAPTEDMKSSLKNLLKDEEVRKEIFDIANGKNVDENVKKVMENSNVQAFVRSILSDPELKELIKKRTQDFPMKGRLFDSLDNPIVQFGLVKTIMSNDIVQKTIINMIKTGKTDSLDAAVDEIRKSLMKSDNFLNNTATILQVGVMGGMTAGAAAGDVIGSYIPVVGRPVFSVLGAATGTLFGGLAGIFGSIGYGIARPFIRDAVFNK